jgi:hypothetical protein
MKTPKTAEASGNKYVTREAFLRRPKARGNVILQHNIEHLLGLLVLGALGGVWYGLFQLFALLMPGPLLISGAITAALAIAILWWHWSWRPRRLAERRRATLLAAVKARLYAVRFNDGSVSDFVPDGFFLTRLGWAIAFDTRHRLVRTVTEESDGPYIDMDWVYGMAAWMRFSVEEAPRRGLCNRLRRAFGRAQRLQTVFALRGPEDQLLRLAIVPDYVPEARRLATKANRAVAEPALGSAY